MWGGRRIPFAFCLVPALAPLLCGCLGRNHVDPDYRFRSDQVAELREQLYRGEFGATARHRDGAEKPDDTRLVAYRQAAPPSAPKRLVLTAALEGEHGGALRVMVELRDQAGRSVRAPAALHLAVLQAGQGTQNTFLGDWDLPDELLEYAWTANWSGGGYRLLLPWKTWPTAEQVRVQARLTLADGTQYEAEEAIPLRAAADTTASAQVAKSAPALEQVQARTGDAGASQASPADLRWAPTPLEGAMRLGHPVRLAEGD